MVGLATYSQRMRVVFIPQRSGNFYGQESFDWSRNKYQTNVHIHNILICVSICSKHAYILCYVLYIIWSVYSVVVAVGMA